MGRADLHTHTTYSDGALTPTELVEHAREVGLAAVAITDHDAVEGVPEGEEAGRRLGVLVVPGVEINTDVPGSEVHMLGYFVDPRSAPLLDTLRRIRQGRLHRAERMVARLNEIGVPIELSRVLEIAGSDGAVGRPHVAQALVEAGGAEDIGEAFLKFLGRGRPGYVPRQKFTPEQAIATILDAGGVPVLAHPGLSGCDDQIRGWVRVGLRGIEIEHSEHGDEQVAHYRRLAPNYGLIATAGSDFHGLPGSRITLGSHTCGLDVVMRLQEAAGRVMA